MFYVQFLYSSNFCFSPFEIWQFRNNCSDIRIDLGSPHRCSYLQNMYYIITFCCFAHVLVGLAYKQLTMTFSQACNLLRPSVLIQCCYRKYFRHHFLIIIMKRKEKPPGQWHARNMLCKQVVLSRIFKYMVLVDYSYQSKKKYQCPVTAFLVSYRRCLTLCTALSTWSPRLTSHNLSLRCQSLASGVIHLLFLVLQR